MKIENEEDKRFFKIKKITNIKDLEERVEFSLPESDLTIQTKDKLIQFEYVTPESEDLPKFVIKPGCFSMVKTQRGLALQKFELKKYDLLESVDNTSVILNESTKFFSKLNVYKDLGRIPKRAVLLASPPGVGKTSAINKICETLLAEEGTSVIVWDTSAIDSRDTNTFFLQGSEYDSKVKKVILVMEDIGGATIESYGGARAADSSLLNLLDGVGNPFQNIPTFIIATTNNPEQSVAALIDRPGRFDKVIKMKTPNEVESIALLTFIAKRELTLEEQEAAKIASKNQFSIAHLQEVVVRSLLDDISMLEVVNQLVAHKKHHAKGFSDTQSIGIGIK